MKVYIYTIGHERALDRHKIAKAGLIVMGTPEDQISYFFAPDHEKYVSVEAVCVAAAQDGFPEFETDLPTSRTSKIITAQIWGYFQLFRKLKEADETAIYIHDDAYLIMPYWKYHGIVKALQARDPDFCFLGLSSNASVRESHPSSWGPYIQGFGSGVGDYANVVGPGFFGFARE